MRKIIFVLLISFAATTLYAQEKTREGKMTKERMEEIAKRKKASQADVIRSKNFHDQRAQTRKRKRDFEKEMYLKVYERNLETFSVWIVENASYPAEAVEKGITGTVEIAFTVTRRGSIKTVNKKNLVKTVHPILDEEVIHLINSAPNWPRIRSLRAPASQNYTIPVNFILK